VLGGGHAVDDPEHARARRLLAQAARQHWAMRAWRGLSAFVLHHVRPCAVRLRRRAMQP